MCRVVVRAAYTYLVPRKPEAELETIRAGDRMPTNAEKLHDAGVLDINNMSQEHRNTIDNDFSDEEVDALIRMKGKLGVGNFTHEDGGAF
ncbi:MAG: hypothetical protein ACJ8DI_04000 [Ktedonobacteraceae bacterium]